MPRDDKLRQNSNNHIDMMKNNHPSRHGANDGHEHGSRADGENHHTEEEREQEQEHFSWIPLEQEYDHQQEQDQQADSAYDDERSSNGGSISDRTEDTSHQQASEGNSSTWEQEENNAGPGCYDNLQINSDGLLAGYSQQEVQGSQPNDSSAFHHRQPNFFCQNIDPSLLTMPPLGQAHLSRYAQASSLQPYFQQQQVVPPVGQQGSIQLQIPQSQTFPPQRATYNQAIDSLAASQQGGNIGGFQPLNLAQISSPPTANLGTTSQLPPAASRGQIQRWRSLQYGPYLQGTRTPRKVVRYSFFNRWLEANRSDIPLPDSSGQGFKNQNAVWESLSPQEQAACDAWVVTQSENEQARHRANGTARYFVANLTPAAVIRRPLPTAARPSSHNQHNIVPGPAAPPPSLASSLNRTPTTTQNSAILSSYGYHNAYWQNLRRPPAAAAAFIPLQSMQSPWTSSFQPTQPQGALNQLEIAQLQHPPHLTHFQLAMGARLPLRVSTDNGTHPETPSPQPVLSNGPQAPMYSGLSPNQVSESYSIHQQDGMCSMKDPRMRQGLRDEQDSGASFMTNQNFQQQAAPTTLMLYSVTQNGKRNDMDETDAEHDHDEAADEDSQYDRPLKKARRS